MMKDKNFYTSLAIKMNTTSIDDAKRAYAGILKLIVGTCLSNGKIELPDLGTFKLSAYKERPVDIVVGGRRTGERMIVDATEVLKFRACRKLREYLNK